MPMFSKIAEGSFSLRNGIIKTKKKKKLNFRQIKKFALTKMCRYINCNDIFWVKMAISVFRGANFYFSPNK